MLEDITRQLMSDVIAMEHHQHQLEHDINLNVDHKDGDHEEHIHVNGVKDITKEVNEDLKVESIQPETIKAETEAGAVKTEPVQSSITETGQSNDVY